MYAIQHVVKDVSKILVLDTELTCWENGIPPEGEVSEIIQVGWCWLNFPSLERTDRRSILVRPQRSRISEYCTNLTGITPKMAKSGIPFEHAMKHLIKQGTRSRAWAAWGRDINIFVEQCRNFSAEYPFSDEFVNVSTLASLFLGLPLRTSLEKAMEILGVTPEGRAHTADSDAWNTAAILAKVAQGKI